MKMVGGGWLLVAGCWLTRHYPPATSHIYEGMIYVNQQLHSNPD
jgi:hypothetical protein